MGSPVFRGLFPSLPTICKQDGEVDEEGQRSVVRYCIEEGADGIACLLFAGEFYKFSDAERKRVARIVVDEVNDEVPVLVGISHSGTLPSVSLGRHAKEIGADGVIAAPPYHASFVTESRLSLLRHYESIAQGIDLPVMIQDYGTTGGVGLSPSEIDAITRRQSNIPYVKVEGGNHLERIRKIIHLTGERVTVFGGMAGYHLLRELRLGTKGSIPGAEMIGPLVDVFRRAESGDAALARARFAQIKPYLRFLIEHFDSFVAVEKDVLRARGIIRFATVRGPSVPLSRGGKAELARILQKMGVGIQR